MSSYQKKLKILIKHDEITQLNRQKEQLLKEIFRQFASLVKIELFQLDENGRYLNAKALAEQFCIKCQLLLSNSSYTEKPDFLGLIYSYLNYFNLWINRADERYVGKINPEEQINHSSINNKISFFDITLDQNSERINSIDKQITIAREKLELTRQKELFKKQKTKEEESYIDALLAEDKDAILKYSSKDLAFSILSQADEIIVFQKYQQFILETLDKLDKDQKYSHLVGLANLYHSQLNEIYRLFGPSYGKLHHLIRIEVGRLQTWFSEFYQKHQSDSLITTDLSPDEITKWTKEYRRIHEITQITQARRQYLDKIAIQEKERQLQQEQSRIKEEAIRNREEQKLKAKEEKNQKNVVEAEKKKAEELAKQQAVEDAKKKKAEEEAKKKADADAKKKADELAKQQAVEDGKKKKAEEEAKKKAEADAKKKAEELAKQQAVEDAKKKKAEEETKKKTEADAKKKAEELIKQQAVEDAKKKNADEDAKKKAEELTKQQAVEDPKKKKAEEEAKKKAEADAKKKAEELAKQQAVEDAKKKKAEEEAKKKAEADAKKKAEELAKQQAAEDAKKKKADEEAKKKAEELAKQQAEEDAKKKKADEEAKKKAEELAKQQAAEDAKKKAEELAKQQAEEDAKKKKAEEDAKKKAEESAKQQEPLKTAMVATSLGIITGDVPSSGVISEKDQIALQREQTKTENLAKKQELDGRIAKIRDEYQQKIAEVEQSGLSPEDKEDRIRDLIRQRSEAEISTLTSRAESVESVMTEAERLKQEKIRIVEERQRMLEEQAKKPRLKALSGSEIEELWEFYFLHKFGHPYPNEFFGGDNAGEVIKRMLQQLTKIYDKLNPTQAVVEQQPGDTKLYYVGDLLGSFETVDILMRYFQPKIFECQARAKPIRIIFLGNYVDYNSMDIHTLLYLITFNILYPQEVLLMRGSHEERTNNQKYGFANRVLQNFDESILSEFELLFTKLPIMHIVDSSYMALFSCHGGVPINTADSRKVINVRKITIDCYKEEINQMDDNAKQLLANLATTKEWKNRNYKPIKDSPGFEYREKIFTNFITKNKFDIMISGNVPVKQGHQYYFNDQLLSLFSAIKHNDEDYEGKILEIIFPPDPEYPEEEYAYEEGEAEEEEEEDEIYYVEDEENAAEPGEDIADGESGEEGEASGEESGEEGGEEGGEEISIEFNVLDVDKLL